MLRSSFSVVAAHRLGLCGAIIAVVAVVAPAVDAQCQLGELMAPDFAAFDHFGNAVAVRGDIAVIGAYECNDVAPDAGCAYVYRYNGTAWQFEQKLTASGGQSNDLFGAAVSTDGVRIVVGAYAGLSLGSLRGAAYVFAYDGSEWYEEAALTPSVPATQDLYGWSVAIDGDLLAVGDPGNIVSVTGPGRVVLYRFGGLNWFEEQTLQASDGMNDDDFGYDVALSNGRLAVGAPGYSFLGTETGRAYLYEYGGIDWFESESFDPGIVPSSSRFGQSVALTSDAFFAGAPELDPGSGGTTGRVYAYHFDGADWQSESTLSPTATTGAHCGSSVACGVDVVIAGAPGTDSVYVFTKSGGAWSEQDPIVGPSTPTDDDYASDVALGAVGAVSYLAWVGAEGSDIGAADAGRVYLDGLDLAVADFTRGNANGDGTVDIGDAIWLLSYVFQGGSAPPCERAGDANADGTLNVADAIYLISFVFGGGPTPSQPYPMCGADPTSSTLCCAAETCL